MITNGTDEQLLLTTQLLLAHMDLGENTVKMLLTVVHIQNNPLITTVPDKIPWATFSLHSGNSF